jgi:hypothetical protein
MLLATNLGWWLLGQNSSTSQPHSWKHLLDVCRRLASSNQILAVEWLSIIVDMLVVLSHRGGSILCTHIPMPFSLNSYLETILTDKSIIEALDILYLTQHLDVACYLIFHESDCLIWRGVADEGRKIRKMYSRSGWYGRLGLRMSDRKMADDRQIVSELS